jgi:hypothetical protein
MAELALGVVLGATVMFVLGFKPGAFWTTYARLAACVAIPAIGWLGYKAANANGAWWSSPASVALLAGIIGAIAPLTAFISNLELGQDPVGCPEAAARDRAG